MAKKVVYHWVEMRHIEVPDECPTDSYDEMMTWLREAGADEALKSLAGSARDCEIVEVTQVQES